MHTAMKYSKNRITLGAALLLVIATLALVALTPGDTRAHEGTHSLVTVEALKPVSFPDQIDARFRIKTRTGGTQVINVRDMDHVLNVKVTIEPGGELPWHTHPGPAVATIQEGSLTVTNASDCIGRLYKGGQGFVDPGHGNVHKAKNFGKVPTILHVTYFEVPIVDGKPMPTIPAEDPGCGVSIFRPNMEY